MKPEEVARLSPEQYLNPDLFVTPMDDAPGYENYRREQYKKGLSIGREAVEVTIACNGTWGYKNREGYTSSYEIIGHHVCTAELLRGFLDSGVQIRVFRSHPESWVTQTIIHSPENGEKSE